MFQSIVLSTANRGSKCTQQLAQQFAQKNLQKASNFAQQRIHLLSNGSDVPQGTVPSCCWSNGPSKMRTLTQAAVQKEDAALHISSCRECLVPLPQAGAADDGVLTCRRCVLVEDLCHQIKELQEEVSGLCSIRNRSDGSFLRHCSLKSQAPNFPEGGAGRVCPGWNGKQRLTGWQRLETCDFWHQEESVCSTSIFTLLEQIQCPHS